MLKLEKRKMNKIDFGFISKIAMYVLLAISVIFVALAFANSDAAVAMEDGSVVEWTLNWAKFMGIFAVVLVVIAEIINILQDTKLLIKAGIVVAGLAALLGIFWALADGTPLNLVGYEGTDNTEFWLKVADTSIFTAYTAFGAAIVSILATEIYQMFK